MDILRLNNLRGAKTVFLIPKRYNKQPILYEGLPPGLPASLRPFNKLTALSKVVRSVCMHWISWACARVAPPGNQLWRCAHMCYVLNGVYAFAFTPSLFKLIIFNPAFTAQEWLIDLTLSNARRFYSSKGDLLGIKGLKTNDSIVFCYQLC